ncbi:MAG: hypothetical protein R6U21_06665 [Thermoplasmatota archaeon]
MLSKRNVTVLPVLFILIIGIILPALHSFPVQAVEVQGNTTFYFKDALSVEGSDPLDFDPSGLIALSKTPPTSTNISYYPPIPKKISEWRNLNKEDLTTWGTYWLMDFLLESEEFDELGGFEDLLGGFELLLPNPLRIVEAYEYTGNESIYLNGDVNFNLFFSSFAPSSFDYNEKDRVEVSIYTYNPDLYFSEKINSTNITLNPSFIQSTQQKQIVIENINHSLNPGQSLLCAIELIPGNKTATNLLKSEKPFMDTVKTMLITVLEKLANRSSNPTFQQIVDIYDMFQNISAEANFTSDDIAEILNSVISTSLVYDSVDYPSSVTVPFSAEPSSGDDNSPMYYLHSDDTIDTQKPTSSEASTISLIDSSGTWSTTVFPRNKIVRNASAFIYVSHKDYQFLKPSMTLSVSLKYDDDIVATDTQSLEKTLSLSPSVRPYQFSFTIPDEKKEISYDQQLSLEVSLGNASSSSIDLLRSCTLYFDAEQYPSSLSVDLSETNHIQASATVSPANKKIIVNDQVTYMFNVTSDLSDDISMTIKEKTFSAAEQANWSISINPDQFNITNGGKKQVTVICESIYNSLKAYEDDPLSATIEITGKTGYTTQNIFAEVSEDAVDYDFEIIAPPEKEIIHGESDSYLFIIRNNNTGLWPDGYNIDAVSEHGFNVSINPLSVRDIATGNQTTINVTITIPDDTEVETDTLEFIVRSKGSGLTKNISVNTTIIGANIFEAIYDAFNSIAEGFGLDEVFGDYAAHAFAAILFIIIFFILILMVYMLTAKYVEVICIDRIKDVHPGETTQYEIMVKNPTKKMQSYQIVPTLSTNGGKWLLSNNRQTVVIPPKQEKQVLMQVTPSDEVEPDDWTEIQVTVTPENKRGCETISLMATLVDGEAIVAIDNVFHWPKSFAENEKVSTSFRLQNKGSMKAKQLSISLQVNGKEKNKVEDIDIPAGGYADISIPWIAEKGKNELSITVS